MALGLERLDEGCQGRVTVGPDASDGVLEQDLCLAARTTPRRMGELAQTFGGFALEVDGDVTHGTERAPGGTVGNRGAIRCHIQSLIRRIQYETGSKPLRKPS